MSKMRLNQRNYDQLRSIEIIPNYTKHAEGSVLVQYGETKVLCTASVASGVPRFLKGQGSGWVTAEYGMLPRATNERTSREAVRGSQAGRTMEIQRLIARSLRAAVDLTKLGENTITVDCDVIQADGGTRTASITGGCVALILALRWLQRFKWIVHDPLQCLVAAVSVGIHKGNLLLDLDYAEDSNADIDMNLVMNENMEYIELQGTAEKKGVKQEEVSKLLQLGNLGIEQLFAEQRKALDEA